METKFGMSIESFRDSMALNGLILCWQHLETKLEEFQDHEGLLGAPMSIEWAVRSCPCGNRQQSLDGDQ